MFFDINQNKKFLEKLLRKVDMINFEILRNN